MRRVALLAVIAITVFATGCGNGRVPTYPVSGRVTLKGKPPTGWIVVLHLEPPPPTGEHPHPLPRADVDETGRFQFHTYEANDGAPAGTYKISFVQTEGANPRQVYWPHKVEVRAEPNEFPPFDITPYDTK